MLTLSDQGSPQSVSSIWSRQCRKKTFIIYLKRHFGHFYNCLHRKLSFFPTSSAARDENVGISVTLRGQLTVEQKSVVVHHIWLITVMKCILINISPKPRNVQMENRKRTFYNYHQPPGKMSTLIGYKICWSFRCSWSIVCRCCSNHIFIFDLILGFNWLGRDNCKKRRVTFKFWDLVWLILEV